MGTRYRNWDELRQIIRAAIAESDPPPLASFNLSPNEEIFFRTRAARAVQRLARQCSGFKAYYVMPTEKPFARVVVLSMIEQGETVPEPFDDPRHVREAS